MGGDSEQFMVNRGIRHQGQWCDSICTQSQEQRKAMKTTTKYNGGNGHTMQADQMEDASELNTSGTVTSKKLLLLLEAQSFCCALSGIKLTPETASLDHIVPVSRGGGYLMGNVQVVHADINRMKGTRTNEEFIELCQCVADYVSNQGTPHTGG